MPLRIELKPNERLIIGETTISQRAEAVEFRCGIAKPDPA